VRNFTSALLGTVQTALTHVAFSSLVKGAGILAGGPYGCVAAIPNPWLPFWQAPLDRVSAAVVACTHYYGDRYYGLRPSAPRAGFSVTTDEFRNPSE
jgi:hypothetical protein